MLWRWIKINFFDNNKKIYVNFIFRKFNFFDPVAQLVEQWPFKPLVVRSSRTRITWGENQVPLIKTLGKCRGFSVSILIIFNHCLSKVGYTYRRMRFLELNVNHYYPQNICKHNPLTQLTLFNLNRYTRVVYMGCVL